MCLHMLIDITASHALSNGLGTSHWNSLSVNYYSHDISKEPSEPEEPSEPKEPSEHKRPIEPKEPSEPARSERFWVSREQPHSTGVESASHASGPELTNQRLVHDRAGIDELVAVLCGHDGRPSEPKEPSEPKRPSEPSELKRPSEPKEPSEPKRPIEPKEPLEPKRPSELKEPSEPKRPSEPKEPSELKRPIEPKEPSEPKRPSILFLPAKKGGLGLPSLVRLHKKLQAM